MPIARRAHLLQQIRSVEASNFEEVALDVFRFQATANPLFADWLKKLGRNPLKINDLAEIPFLPISFFKTHVVQTGRWRRTGFFTSSGTTGQIPSRHAVRSLDFYLENTARGFEQFYGKIEDWAVVALLPSYLERSGSSLVAMADFFIQKTGRAESGFFLDDFEKLIFVLEKCQKEGRKTLLLGVSFALLDLAERLNGRLDFSKITIMETGGMKGRRKEITRAELHETLRNSLKINTVHSEYGMTELFSQAYSTASGEPFQPSPTLRVFVKEINDPFASQPIGRAGQLCLIDLANVDSCSFIATEDVGRVFENGHFEVLGRLDVAEMRGCNLMVE